MKKLVVVIDTQYDFMMEDGALPVPGAEGMIVDGNRYLANLKADDTVGVLFTFDTHTPDVYNGSPESEQFPIHCVKGTPGWENVFNLRLLPDLIPVLTLEKGVFNMWEEDTTRIRDFARDTFFNTFKDEFDYVEIWGVALNVCVKYAVEGFVKRGYRVKVVEHLVRGIDLGAPADLDPNLLFQKLANVTIV